MTITYDQLEALQREHFQIFLRRAFAELHPGQEFIPNWHIDAICEALQGVYEGRITRLLITMPPRSLKSVCASIAFPAWVLCRDPTMKIMTASYGDRLARDHMEQFRALMASGWYLDLSSCTRISSLTNRAGEIRTTRGGGRWAISRGGAGTGFGADIIIVDDLMKADDARSETERANTIEFFENTLLSRLNDQSTGRIIVLQQRLHEADLPGHLIATGQYHHLNLPAIARTTETHDIGFGRTHTRRIGEALFPAREPLEVLERMRAEMGSHVFEAQYQQNPVPPGGAIVHADWFSNRYDACPERRAFSRVVQSWDLGTSDQPNSDFTVGLTLGYHDCHWYLLDVFRRRMELPDVRANIIRLQQEWRADKVILEYVGSSIGVLQDLRRLEGGRGTYLGHTPGASKEERLLGQTPKLADGLIRLPADAPWVSDFINELVGFPYARHDDQVDALSQFLENISERSSKLHPSEGRRRRRR